MDSSTHSASLRRSLRRVESMLSSHAVARSARQKYNSNTGISGANSLVEWAGPHDSKSQANPQQRSSDILLRTSGSSGGTKRAEATSTQQTIIYSFLWYHLRFAGSSITRSPDLRILLQGIKRLSDPTKKKQAITPAFLRVLRRSMNLNLPHQRLLWGSVLLPYFLLLRSEYLLVNKQRAFYSLENNDVLFNDSRGNQLIESVATAVTIGLSGAKNDQFGRGAWRTMHRSGDPTLRPVRALKHIRHARRALGMEHSRLLSVNLDANTVATAIKKAASSAGVPAENYSTHSIPIGGATALLNGKAESLSIKLLGRWVSRVFEDYPVQAASATTDLASRMI